MAAGLQLFVGRTDELEQLASAVTQACAGSGSLWLVSGEPGIGKSRLIEELSERVDDEVLVAWGRCSEAGGAPAYWPFVQVLRALRRRVPDDPAWRVAGRASQLASLLPELEAEPGPRLDPDRARFELLDAAAAALCDVAERTPVLLVLEDLHAADAESLALLELLAPQLKSARIAAVGTLRDSDAERASAYPLLSRVSRHARLLPLRPLAREHVHRFLDEAFGQHANDALAATVHRVTEGNALFLVEIARRLVARGGPGPDSTTEVEIPRAVETALRERLHELSPETLRALEAGSVLGRDLPVGTLAALSELTPEALAPLVREATEAGVLVPAGEAQARFSHILFREVLYRGLSPDRRAALHVRAAEQAREAHADPPWSEIAHHYLAGGHEAVDRGVHAARRAAERALAHLAFEEAVQWQSRALGAFARRGTDDPALRFELLLGLGRARILSGDVSGGRADCVAAAAVARDLDAADLLARAALEHGAELIIAEVDPTLVSLLEEALGRLGEAETPLRARVMARLAAALQPAADPTHPIELAREAIAMARRLGDEDTLVAALRNGCSAMMDLSDPRERTLLNHEHARLAEKRNEPAEALRAHTRIVFDCYEVGDTAGAAAAIEECVRISARLGHPRYRWRTEALRAIRAAREGRFEDAERHTAEAEAIGQQTGDAKIAGALLQQRIGRLRLANRMDELVELVTQARATLSGDTFGDVMARVYEASVLGRAGRVEEARRRMTPETIARCTGSDLSTLALLADYAIGVADRDLVATLFDELRAFDDRFVSFGMYGMHVEGPAVHVRARLASALGRRDDAERCFDAARALVGADAPPLLAAIERDWEASRAEASRARPEPDAPDLVPQAGRFTMRLEGGLWVIAHEGETFHVKDVKGLHILARLVEEPGRELHVLDLSNPARATEAADGSDAGEMIDAQARDAYRTRVRELREALAEAEQWNDAGRAERARAELEAIEAELARAVGLGGRTRRAGAAAERARINVQRRLKDAIARIEAEHPALGRHLEWAVRTGTYCSYRPW